VSGGVVVERKEFDRLPHLMRTPCRYGCDTTLGYLTTRGGQDVVRCWRCEQAQYNAPKTEM